MPTDGVYDLMKPFLVMALTAFLVGFFSYFLFHGSEPALAQDTAPWTATVSGPSSSDWNMVKHI